MQIDLSARACIGPIRLITVGGMKIHAFPVQVFRYQNVCALIAAEGGPAKFAKRVGKDDSQITQIAGPRPSRNIGNDQARDLEQILGLEEGVLDRPPPRSAMVEEAADELEHRDPEIQKYVLELVKRLPRHVPAALAASALPARPSHRSSRKPRKRR